MKTPPKVKMSLLTFRRKALEDPQKLHAEIFKTYGDIAWKKVKGIRNYYFGHPDHAKHILEDNQDNYIYKHPFLVKIFSPFIGYSGLFTTNDLEQWYKDRVIAKMSLVPDVYFRDYSKTIVSLCDGVLKNWEKNYKDNELINIGDEIDKLLVNIAINTLFIHLGLEDAGEFSKFIGTTVRTIKRKFEYLPGFLWQLSPDKRKYQESLKRTKEIAVNIIKQRLNENKDWDDLLGNFIQKYKDLNKNELIEHISWHLVTFIVVTYFTTTSLLHWLIVTLSQYPMVVREIRAELNHKIGNRLPNYDDLNSLPYLSAVIKETLRIHPSSFAIVRQSLQDDTIGGFHIPAKAGIVISIASLHRHPDFWDNPDGFDPRRFLDNPLGQTNRFAYIPFGGGKRTCIGSAFSTMEITLISAMILQRFNLYLPSHAEIHPYTTTLISNRPNIWKMRLQRQPNEK